MTSSVFGEADSYISRGLKLGKVLVVEDEQLWQVLILKALKKMNKSVEVSFCENAAQALNEIVNAENNQFDLIISDQSLENSKTGLDLWNLLVEKNYDIPYVLLSGTSRTDFFKGMNSSAEKKVPHYIEKSSSVAHLVNQLNFFVAYNAPVVTRVCEEPKSVNLNYWQLALIGLIVLMYSPHIMPKDVTTPNRGPASISIKK